MILRRPRRGSKVPRALVFACCIGIPASCGAAQGYVDRVLDVPAPNDDADVHEEESLAGLTRSMRMEYSLAGQQVGAVSERFRGLTVGGFVQTTNYGALSLDASASSAHSSETATPRSPVFWRVDQRALPLGDGWLANHSAGHIGTPLPPLAQGFGRVTIPGNPIAGVAGSWSHGRDLVFNASTGRSGLFFSGLDANGFLLDFGRMASAGAQWNRLTDAAREEGIEAAAQMLHATDVPSRSPGLRTRTDATWTSLAWQGVAPWAEGVHGAATLPLYERSGGLRVQAQWLRSESDAIPTQGGWLDAAWRTEWLRNTAGVYRFEPGLRWGTLALPGDLQGAYWRADVNTQLWQLGWLLEGDTPVTGAGRADSFSSIYGRYRVSSDTGIGGGAAVRGGLSAARQLDLSVAHHSSLGQSAARLRFIRGKGGDFASVSLDHAWPVALPWSLSTAFTQELQSGAAGSSHRTLWGLLAGYVAPGGARFDASLRDARGNAGRSTSVNFAATWQMRRDWSFAVRAYLSRGQEPQLTELSSALAQAMAAPAGNAPTVRGVQFSLRYEWRAGNTPAPIGGAPGSGAGAISGVVFLDANANGRRDASEAGAPNVAVMLDGRFVARTDPQGRFEFPAVVAGPHTLRIETDNIPLPWSPTQRERADLDVRVRGTTTFDFALRREFY